ncbi:hypothetical protein [Candidatus Vampirococcus lugosii]|uniref:Autotransporter domain-containing protein n=1 Tax=Candidatus Vampirococcus lugosii TaxID=2789015 RepID=A0ABS5QPK0_9BACT|nr:hypothetical protein [Candidatus Vampirococcus lugosii]MBS8122466.1 hypothetical protein [Candidatus Vampirococcus lugosii]
MKIKILYIKYMFITFLLSILGIGATHSFGILEFEDLAQALSGNVSEMHFYVLHDNGVGNDFGGFMILTDIDDMASSKTLKIENSSDSITCEEQLRGFYFNPLRGSTLYAIDEYNYEYMSGSLSGGMNMGYDFDGGFYSNCRGQGVEPTSIFGHIEYGDLGAFYAEDFFIQAGREYDYNTNRSTNNDYADSFSLYNNTPVGLIYDSLRGVGFVGGKVNHRKCMEDLFAETNDNSIIDLIHKFDPDSDKDKRLIFTGSIYNDDINQNCITRNHGSVMQVVSSVIGILGGYYLGEQGSEASRRSVISRLGQLGDDATQQQAFNIGGKTVNLSSSMNTLKKNASDLCRGQWDDTSGPIGIDSGNKDRELFCIDGQDVVLDYDLTSSSVDNIILIKNGNLTIKKNQKAGNSNLQVFIDGGVIKIDIGSKVDIDKDGFYTTSTGVTEGLYLYGDYFINGLLVGTDTDNKINNKLYINGRMALLNSPQRPTDSREKMIKRSIGDTAYNNYKDIIGMRQLFAWDCKPNGKGTDGVNCSDSSDRWRRNSFIIQPNGIESRLLRD